MLAVVWRPSQQWADCQIDELPAVRPNYPMDPDLYTRKVPFSERNSNKVGYDHSAASSLDKSGRRGAVETIVAPWPPGRRHFSVSYLIAGNIRLML